MLFTASTLNFINLYQLLTKLEAFQKWIFRNIFVYFKKKLSGNAVNMELFLYRECH